MSYISNKRLYNDDSHYRHQIQKPSRLPEGALTAGGSQQVELPQIDEGIRCSYFNSGSQLLQLVRKNITTARFILDIVKMA